MPHDDNRWDFFADPHQVQQWIANVTEFVLAAGTDGVALDFEFASTNHSIREGLTQAVSAARERTGFAFSAFLFSASRK